MKLRSIHLAAVCLLFPIFQTSASVFYVDVNSTNPVLPYAGWDTAATNIQDAIDAASDGDQIWVTNGIYQTGGRVMAGSLTNRVALNKAVTVQSVNGPWVTIIQGWRTNMNNPAAVRCAWLTNNAALIGFTLKWGTTQTSGDTSGGGVWCASSNALVANCVIVSNQAFTYGGGAYQGTLENCLIWSNSVNGLSGGGVCNAVLLNCTVISNANVGIYQTAPNLIRVTNCIIYFNPNGNYGGPPIAFSYCCTTPAATGTGNFTNAPNLFVDGIHLTSTSPCVGAGTSVATGTDIFGTAWANPPSIGCAEFDPSPLVTSPQIQLTSDPVGFTVGGVAIAGQPLFSCWWLKDGVPLQDNAHFSFTQTTNLVATGVSFADAGSYQLVVSNAVGVVTSAVAQLVAHCVDVAGTNPVVPYLTWATAATNIQDAITASVAGDIVLVTNGLYAGGGKTMDGVITNRVSVDKAIIVQGVNGPGATVIQGMWDPVSTNGPGAVRCAWLTNNATLSGFTLRGGATSTDNTSPYQSTHGGGIFGASTNAVAFNCVFTANSAAQSGGGAYRVTLNNCSLLQNQCLGGSSDGGGAYGCNLRNCTVVGNYAYENGGGTSQSNLRNCAITKNRAIFYGSGAYQGTLVNCTIVNNTSGGYGSYGGAVASVTLTNCIVYGNFNIGSGLTNYYSCTFSYSDTDPLPSGGGNMDIDPQLLADGVHLAATSPCIGAGTPISVVSGTDIDGQPWNNPPSIGCDEWQPAPVVGAQPCYQINSPAHGLTFSVVIAGQSPFSFFWSKDGEPIQDDGHHSNSGTANLVVNHFGPDDAGMYQVVVTNTFGMVTSTVAQVVIHAVDAAGINPVPPYSTWATAATNIQDAITASGAGDIVLVTNGVYASGGEVKAGDLTNRVALDKAIFVTSVNGYAATVIQGAWDPASTNGLGAVRCAWLADGAILNGFTLQNGATRSTGNSTTLQSGGGVWCTSTNGVVSDCVLTNNVAIYGGGIAYGTLDNSLVAYNLAAYGGGAYYATLNNCTVVYNYTTTPNFPSSSGAGTYYGAVQNCVVMNNYDDWPFLLYSDNYYQNPSYYAQYSYSCTYPLPSGTGNINGNSASQQFLDLFHIATTSPCRGAGSALYASGTDLDDEPWATPPSMGCDEVVVSNLVGPLSVNLLADQTNLLVSAPNLILPPHTGHFQGIITGHAASVAWSFGDGPTITNLGANTFHQWTNAGDYTVIFTAYNNDNPAGASTNTVVHVLLPNVPQLQSSVLLTNGFQFQFVGQSNANYTIQYTPNLAPPVAWQTLQTIYYSSGGTIQINDSATSTARFYRVLAQ
jgi:hypothetical protein